MLNILVDKEITIKHRNRCNYKLVMSRIITMISSEEYLKKMVQVTYSLVDTYMDEI